VTECAEKQMRIRIKIECAEIKTDIRIMTEFAEIQMRIRIMIECAEIKTDIRIMTEFADIQTHIRIMIECAVLQTHIYIYIWNFIEYAEIQKRLQGSKGIYGV
jgi:hypothetical protein